MRAFIGITRHFNQDWTAHSVMLSCKSFKGKHTAKNIRYKYEETLAVFEIADKICTIVTDKVYRPDRCSLNNSTFETLKMIKCNGNVN